MNPLNILKPKIQVIYDMMRHGLIHPRRYCTFCTHEMRIIYNITELYEYLWACPMCFKQERITHSTPMLGLNFVKFDVAIELWGHNCNSRQAHFLMNDSAMADFFIIIRKAVSRYIEENVKRYIRFADQIDIDETLIGQQRWSYMGHFPQLRWVFGLLCR